MPKTLRLFVLLKNKLSKAFCRINNERVIFKRNQITLKTFGNNMLLTRKKIEIKKITSQKN